MKRQLSQGGTCSFLTTENVNVFMETATQFLAQQIEAQQIKL
jgi:hypothetical protein